MMMDQIIPIRADQARLNITWNGQNGDLADPVPYDATDDEIRFFATEALRGGGTAGLERDPRADFSDFVVDRFPSTDAIPFNRIFVRPKTPFGRTEKHGPVSHKFREL